MTGGLDPADVVTDAPGDEVMTVLRERCDRRELAVVDLLLDGERRSQMFARAIDLQDRPRAEQVREVKRAKDGLKKRLRRRLGDRPRRRHGTGDHG